MTPMTPESIELADSDGAREEESLYPGKILNQTDNINGGERHLSSLGADYGIDAYAATDHLNNFPNTVRTITETVEENERLHEL